MSRRTQQPQRGQPPVVPQPPKRRYVWYFRWEWILVPIALALAAWFITGAKAPALTFDSVMGFLHVRDRERYTQLAVLGCVLVALVWIRRVLRDERKD